MPVIRDIQVHIARDEVLRRQTRKEPSALMLSLADWAIERAGELLEPAAAYAVFESEGVDGEDLILQGGSRLKLGPHADLIAPAQRVIASVATIGPRLEEEVRRLMAGPDVMKGYLLDCAGVVAVSQTSLAIREMVEEMARAEEWGVGPSLYPGSPMGWTVRGQRELLSLLDTEQIGVRLTSSCMMVPQKSSSGLIGIGPGYDESQVGTLCHWCSLQDSCWRRKEKIAVHG
jgi:hypothetical protein